MMGQFVIVTPLGKFGVVDMGRGEKWREIIIYLP
jgi:hypothetical protein